MKHNNYIFLTILACIIAIGSFSCASFNPTNDSQNQVLQSTAPSKNTNKDLSSFLVNKTWILTGINLENTWYPLEIQHGTNAKLLFKNDGTLSGHTGTNLFMGTWAQTNKQIKDHQGFEINLGGMTMMASINEQAAKFEQDLIKTLALVAAIETNKDSIRLFNKANEVLLEYTFTGQAQN